MEEDGAEVFPIQCYQCVRRLHVHHWFFPRVHICTRHMCLYISGKFQACIGICCCVGQGTEGRALNLPASSHVHSSLIM